MNDLELSLINHDLVIENGDLTLLDKEERVARQTLTINLLFFEGEWFLDIEHGIPYFQSILRKNVTKSVVDSLFRRAILSSYNITEILELTSSVNEDRYVINKLRATTVQGDIVSINNQVIGTGG